MISFSCPTCSQDFRVGDDKAGRRTKCPRCSESLVVPSPRPSPRPALPLPPDESEAVPAASARPPVPVPPTGEPVPAYPGRRPSYWPAYVAFGLAVSFIIAAGVANKRADERDYQELRHANSLNDLRLGLAQFAGDYRGLKMDEPRKADRTAVWACGVIGVVLLGVGLICVSQVKAASRR